MLIDIVFPKGNEQEFISMAKKIGYKGLCLIYNLKDIDSSKEKLLKSKAGKDDKFNLFFGVICQGKDVVKAKKKSDLVIVEANEKARVVIEQNKPDLIFGIENDRKRDYMHQRNAGLNQVLCNLANKKGVSYAIGFEKVLESKHKTQFLGRFKQNLMLCSKYKTDVVLASFASSPLNMRNPKDMVSFFSLLGLTENRAKDATNSLSRLLKTNIKTRQKKMSDGIELVE